MDSDEKKKDKIGSVQHPKKIDPLISNLWLPPILLLLILLVFLIYILVPGTLMYPNKQVANNLFGNSQTDIEIEVERSLRLRVEELESAINTGTCSAGVYEIPNDSVSLMPPENSGNALAGDGKRPLMMPPVNRLSAQLSDGSLNLEELIRKSTVLIFSGEGEIVSMGTGFFINNNLFFS